MLRKKLLIPIFFLIFSISMVTNLNAQLLNLSVKGGVTLADISGEYPIETSLKTGFSVYVSKDFVNLLVLTISGEAGYTQKGFDSEIIFTDSLGVQTGSDNVKANLNYISLSILGKARIPGGVTFPYILAGFNSGIKVGSSASAEGNSSVSALENTLNDFSTFTFGFTFGLGIDVGLPFFSLLAEARYTPDITVSYDQNNANVKNRLYEFLIGVKF
jgi:hypothetical protein